MVELTNVHVDCRLEHGGLVLTIKETHLQEEKLVEGLLQEMNRAVDHYGARRVIVDMNRLKYLSSVAFRPLLALRRKMLEINGRLVLCGLSSVVGDVFYTTRLVDATGKFSAPFEMADDVPAALARLNTQPPAP